MKRCPFILLPIVLLVCVAGCGTGANNPSNVGLFGNWNVAMYPTNNANPAYVFALALSQLGSSTYSGASIAYNGAVAPPGNMCINANSLRATATLGSNNNFNMTITDTSTNTIISVEGSLSTVTNELSGTYTNGASQACPASQGTVTMIPQ
ncbi:MAG TPA: hypothetical protein VGG15_03845 [Terriglobales bacterium]|jgi:hypothetical protein